MSQQDFEITAADANTGVTVRAAINSALQALASCSSGATEPTTMYAYQWWADTTTGLLKQRNAANTAWITIGTLASVNLGLAPKASPSFTVGIGVGGAAAGTGGVAFPATAVAVTDVNTLDDYEEGAWTPDLQFGGAKVGITYGGTNGYYTKIGNIVTVTGRIQLSSKGSSAGAATIAGLPFTSFNNVAAASGVAFSYMAAITFTGWIMGHVYINSTEITLFESTEAAGAMTPIDNSNFADTSQSIFSCTYRVA